ncbi:hypothetical protein Ae168Ps1_5823c [Pseudonocardia sp. Ae168_Ps1]|nr:hypothetical protein Ae168Ps1_5823c [Pseudonocardia sp. Ae168_Ps1]
MPVEVGRRRCARTRRHRAIAAAGRVGVVAGVHSARPRSVRCPWIRALCTVPPDQVVHS